MASQANEPYTIKVCLLIYLQSRQAIKPTASPFSILLPPFPTVRNNHENPGHKYDYSSEMYPTNTERFDIGGCIPNVQGVSKKATDILEVNILVCVVAYTGRSSQCTLRALPPSKCPDSDVGPCV